MNKTIKTLTFSAIFIFLAAVGLANELLFYKEMQAPRNMSNEVGAVTLDSQIYLHTDNTFANLRIYDQQENEVPYVVRKLRGEENVITDYPVEMKILSLEELPENRLSIILEKDEEKQKKGEERLPSDMIINTPNNNFEKTVAVFGSNDKDQWELLCSDQLIFDYSRFIDLRNTSVSFSKKPFKYYKVIIDNVSQALISSFSRIFTKYAKGKVQQEYSAFTRYKGVLRINKLKFISREEKPIYGQKQMVPYALDITEVKINEKNKTSEIYLHSNREPLNRLLFRVKTQNFKRKIIVEANNALSPRTNWVSLASSEIYNISAGSFHKEKIKIDLSGQENRYEQYRARIFNYDNAPIEIMSVCAEGAVHEMVFFHKNQKSLKVYYGGQDIKFPQYDISSVLAEMPMVTGERWQLGQEKNNEKAEAKKKSIIPAQKLFMIALTLMVIALVYLIVVSVKKVDETTK